MSVRGTVPPGALSGRGVSRCYFNKFEVAFEAWEEADFFIMLTISGPFRLTSATGTVHVLHGLRSPRRDLAPLIGILDSDVIEAIKGSDGTLTVEFTNGVTIEIPPGQQTNSWVMART
jgi:hypothetical protein